MIGLRAGLVCVGVLWVGLLGATTVLAAETAGTTPGPASATTVRVGDHPGYSRVVFDLPPDATSHIVTEGQRLLLVFKGAGGVARPADLPRNLRAMQTGADTATLHLVPGAKARPVRIGDRLVVDILDPGATTKSTRTAAKSAAPRPGPDPIPAPVPTPAPALAPAVSEPPVAPPSTAAAAIVPEPDFKPVPAPPLPTAQPQAAPRIPVIAIDAPAAAPAPPPVVQAHAPPPTAVAAPVPPARPSPVLVIRADSDVGAAAFRRGPFGLVVLDRRLAEQPVAAGMTWTKAAVSTIVKVPLPEGSGLALRRSGDGWSVEVATHQAAGTLTPMPRDDGLSVALPRPGRTMAVLDPVTGGTLLVGASLDTGSGVAESRRTPGYQLLPSWLGVAVETYSDQVDLRPAETGFVLTGGALASGSSGTALTRRFEFPGDDPAVLLNRLRVQLASAADAPPRARSRFRTAAVQTMLGLGMGAEAQSVAQLIAAEDPQVAADAQTGALAAIAAIMADRPAEGAALDDPRLDGTDEIALWRGLRDRKLGRTTEAARRLGEMAALAGAYPDPLRRLVWPAVAEAAVEAGLPVAIDTLPDLLKAILLERTGKVDEALAAYDAVVAGPDRLAQVRAAARAAELRLASGRLGPADAAATMERLSFAWRGDAREAGFRLRAADLQAAARQWRPALEALRAIEAAFPDQQAAVQARKVAVMQAMLTAEGAGLSALDLVLLAADYADCVPEGPAGSVLARLLVGKLAALDLPARAIPVLQGLMRSTQAGEARAEFGLTLAQLLLEGGDAEAAGTTLEASAAPALPAPVQERRDLLQAKLQAAKGDVSGAVAMLKQLGTDQADELRATLLAKAADWPGSLAALTALAARRIPRDGALDEAAQDLLVRQADAAAQARDAVALQSLRQLASRITGPRADVFRLLTAPPLRTFADLPRAGLELAAARDLPQRLHAAGMR